MNSFASMILAIALSAAFWLGPTSVARAETFNCTAINTLPATISTPGHYCLNKNFSQDFAETAIRITSDDVVLDCNNHAVIHSNPNGLTNGIQSDSHSNVIIRNCVTSGFYVAIYLPEYSIATSKNNQVLNNNVSKSRYTAIIVNGSNNLIEGNRVSNVLANYAGNNAGIELSSAGGEGTGNVIRGNVIADFKPGLANFVYGIHFYGIGSTIVADNTVEGLSARTGSGVWGISGEYQLGTSITGNTVLSNTNATAPYDGGNYYGIALQYGAAGDELTNICADNTVGHFNSDVYGCVDVNNTKF